MVMRSLAPLPMFAWVNVKSDAYQIVSSASLNLAWLIYEHVADIGFKLSDSTVVQKKIKIIFYSLCHEFSYRDINFPNYKLIRI